MKEKKRGKPTKLTPSVQKIICDALEKGLTRKLACQLAIIGESTFHEWMDRKDNEIYTDFAESIRKAEGKFAEKHLSRISIAGTDDKHWQANAWMLERVLQKDYGKNAAIEALDDKLTKLQNAFEKLLIEKMI